MKLPLGYVAYIPGSKMSITTETISGYNCFIDNTCFDSSGNLKNVELGTLVYDSSYKILDISGNTVSGNLFILSTSTNAYYDLNYRSYSLGGGIYFTLGHWVNSSNLKSVNERLLLSGEVSAISTNTSYPNKFNLPDDDTPHLEYDSTSPAINLAYVNLSADYNTIRITKLLLSLKNDDKTNAEEYTEKLLTKDEYIEDTDYWKPMFEKYITKNQNELEITVDMYNSSYASTKIGFVNYTKALIANGYIGEDSPRIPGFILKKRFSGVDFIDDFTAERIIHSVSITQCTLNKTTEELNITMTVNYDIIITGTCYYLDSEECDPNSPLNSWSDHAFYPGVGLYVKSGNKSSTIFFNYKTPTFTSFKSYITDFTKYISDTSDENAIVVFEDGSDNVIYTSPKDYIVTDGLFYGKSILKPEFEKTFNIANWDTFKEEYSKHDKLLNSFVNLFTINNWDTSNLNYLLKYRINETIKGVNYKDSYSTPINIIIPLYSNHFGYMASIQNMRSIFSLNIPKIVS